MESQLRELVENTSTKHLGHAIKKHPELHTWIMSQTQAWPQLNLSQRVRCILYKDTPVCSVSNQIKLWKSMQEGFGFCGRASQCACARQSVSLAVAKSKNNITESQQQVINQKRVRTNLDKYGVTNTGQTEKAKQAHQSVYADASKVQQIIDQIQKTNQDKYGVTNPMQLDSVKQKSVQTVLQKYGVHNINQLPERRQHLAAQAKQTWIKRKQENFDYLRLKHKLLHEHKVHMLTESTDYVGTVGANYYEFKCDSCAHEWRDYVYCGHIPTCKMCNPGPSPSYVSQQEQDLAHWIEHLGIQIERTNKRLINPYELDIVCHDHKLAIEYCGLYWHSETASGKTPNYHVNKLQLCNQKGYRLITIFSDEWQFKTEIVKQKLSNILGVTETKIGARSCKIITLENNQVKPFMETHHIQGWAPGALINMGLEYDNQLVAVMSLSALRSLTNNRSAPAEWELLRYATSMQVVGGAGRLLRAFEQQHKPRRIISYADRRWSEGHVYQTLGFTLVQTSTPGYSYTPDYLKREHRISHTKGKLVKLGFDSSLTEWQIQQQRGYDRIWDCGQLKFEKIYPV